MIAGACSPQFLTVTAVHPKEETMAIKILKKTGNIELCHALLRERLHYDAYQKYHVRLQRRADQPEGEDEYADIAWMQQFGFWMELSNAWRLNTFGQCDHAPGTWETQQVLCEFDFRPGHSGAFCRDQYSGILLLHSGNIRSASGANLNDTFWRDYRGPQLTGAEQQEQPLAVVAHLGCIDVARQIKEFLQEVARIRAAAG